MGASASGLAFLSLVAAFLGIAGKDPPWIDWAIRTFLGGLVVQSISFFGRPRSLSVLVAWLCVAVGFFVGLFGLFNVTTLLCFSFAQLVMIERYRKPPRALPNTS